MGQFYSLELFLVIIIFVNLAFFAPKGEEEFPVAEAEDARETAPMVFENWKLWLGIAVFLFYSLTQFRLSI